MGWWNVRLEGGPADGDHAEIQEEPSERIWVGWCEGHREWHWFHDPYEGCERYVRREHDRQSQITKFVWEDLLTGSPGLREEVFA